MDGSFDRVVIIQYSTGRGAGETSLRKPLAGLFDWVQRIIDSLG
jgi:hypothetical protein